MFFLHILLTGICYLTKIEIWASVTRSFAISSNFQNVCSCIYDYINLADLIAKLKEREMLSKNESEEGEANAE